MAISELLKSSSNAPENDRRSTLLRRSRSVSSLSRSSSHVSPSPCPSKPLDFVNKVDNPLFCPSSSSSVEEIDSEVRVPISKFNKSLSQASRKTTETGASDANRGRPASRNSNARDQASISRSRALSISSRVGSRRRSVSRVDTGRRRCHSVSRDQTGSSKREGENEHNLHQILRDAKVDKLSHREVENGESIHQIWRGAKVDKHLVHQERNADSERRFPESSKPTNSLRTWTSVHPPEASSNECCTFQRKGPSIISANDVADIPPELVNTNAIELVSDIRREYATKLKQSQERARKLRADLTVEEQRALELERILKDVLPDPKLSGIQNIQKKKACMEKCKISRMLTEEALNYFDECVSISTFDSSDFSTAEELPVLANMAACTKESDNQSPCSFFHLHSDFTAGCSSVDGNQSDVVASDTIDKEFSYDQELGDALDIKSCIKKFGKKLQDDVLEQPFPKSVYDPYRYQICASDESILYDKVIFKSRIEYGGLLMCNISLV